VNRRMCYIYTMIGSNKKLEKKMHLEIHIVRVGTEEVKKSFWERKRIYVDVAGEDAYFARGGGRCPGSGGGSSKEFGRDVLALYKNCRKSVLRCITDWGHDFGMIIIR